jgi:hypothetical protein
MLIFEAVSSIQIIDNFLNLMRMLLSHHSQPAVEIGADQAKRLVDSGEKPHKNSRHVSLLRTIAFPLHCQKNTQALSTSRLP